MLRTRILSALVLAPLVLLAIWFGGYAFLALVSLAGGLMGWEWARMTGAGRFGPQGVALALGLAVLPAAFSYGGLPAGLVWLLLVLIVVALSGALADRKQVFWLVPGLFYLGLACLAFLWLRLAPFNGPAVVFWLLAVVWATDIGAYFAGRGIGGPKLAPRVSPNKTWAGLIGGMIAAAAVSAVAAVVLDWTLLAPVLGGALLAVVAQGGDLLESWSKRRFGVKDSSHIIPGHGGILDRVDGLLSVFPVAFLYFWAVGASF